MSFWQDLVTAYDANFDALQKYYPLSTTTINNNSDDIINVVLDKNGNLIKTLINSNVMYDTTTKYIGKPNLINKKETGNVNNFGV